MSSSVSHCVQSGISFHPHMVFYAATMSTDTAAMLIPCRVRLVPTVATEFFAFLFRPQLHLVFRHYFTSPAGPGPETVSGPDVDFPGPRYVPFRVHPHIPELREDT